MIYFTCVGFIQCIWQILPNTKSTVRVFYIICTLCCVSTTLSVIPVGRKIYRCVLICLFALYALVIYSHCFDLYLLFPIDLIVLFFVCLLRLSTNGDFFDCPDGILTLLRCPLLFINTAVVVARRVNWRVYFWLLLNTAVVVARRVNWRVHFWLL